MKKPRVGAEEYSKALQHLNLMEPLVMSPAVDKAVRESFVRTRKLLVDGRNHQWRGLNAQSVRDGLYELRGLMEEKRTSLYAPSMMFRHCDKAIQAVLGEDFQFGE